MFHCKSVEDIQATVEKAGASLPFAQTTQILTEPVQAGSLHLNNRIAIQPMEGCDGTPDG